MRAVLKPSAYSHELRAARLGLFYLADAFARASAWRLPANLGLGEQQLDRNQPERVERRCYHTVESSFRAEQRNRAE